LLEKIYQDTLVTLDNAENGKIGLEKFEKKNNYDLILLDLQMAPLSMVVNLQYIT